MTSTCIVCVSNTKAEKRLWEEHVEQGNCSDAFLYIKYVKKKKGTNTVTSTGATGSKSG